MAVLLEDNIIFGGETSRQATKSYRSLGHYLLETLKEHANDVTLIDALKDRSYTRKEFRGHVVRMAYCLNSLGVSKGDVIGICSENFEEVAVTLVASLVIGSAAAPLNVTYTERELTHALRLSRPKVVFCSPSAVNKLVAVSKQNDFIKYIFVYGDTSPNPRATPFAELVNNKSIVSFTEYDSPAANKNDDVCIILCSSGTTGLPKGVQITQNNILSTIDQFVESMSPIFEKVTILSTIPWFHSYGCITLLIGFCMRSQAVFLPKFEEVVFLRAIEKYKVAVAFLVPPLVVFLAKHPIVDQYDLSSLIALFSGAAPLSKEIEDAVKERIGVQMIRQGYGLSESTLSLIVQTDEYCKPGSVGCVKAGVYAKVIDTETGQNLGPNQRGELCFKGPCIMKGYIGDDKATSETIIDGWLHTGDIGYYDDDLVFFIVDRIKELIKYKAFQVPPAEIEGILLTHPKIKDAAVIGKPDDISGELPLAFVVKQAGTDLTEKEVIEYVAKHASPAKRLRGGVIFINEVPKNPSGKILRRVLRDQLKNQPKPKL